MDKREHPRKLPPLASSEDLSEDLLDSPEADTKSKCLEGIAEVPCGTPAKSPRQQTLCLAMPNAPRIDISRASSSSHHDDSSPERDLFVGESPIRLFFIVSEDYFRGRNKARSRIRYIRGWGDMVYDHCGARPISNQCVRIKNKSTLDIHSYDTLQCFYFTKESACNIPV